MKMDYKHLKEILQDFNATDDKEYPPELESVLTDTAKSGIVRFSWDLLKPFVRYRLQQVLDASFEGQDCKNDEGMCEHLLEQLDKFDNPPFTIQRVCELITSPKKHYKKIGAYMRAMERNLLVVSTQEPDLTWMKSPRLTQLLEEPVHVSNKDDQVPSSPVESNTRTLINSPPPDRTSKSPDKTTQHADDTPNSINNGTSQQSSLQISSIESQRSAQNYSLDISEQTASRKRKSCERDEPSGATPHLRDDEEARTVLQEADSTTTVGVDQDETPMDTTPSSVDTDIEGNVAKRLKPSSPEDTVSIPIDSPIVSGEDDMQCGGAGEDNVVSSQKIQNASTGQAESCLGVDSNTK